MAGYGFHTITCARCGSQDQRGSRSGPRPIFCWQCAVAHNKETQRAMARVATAVRQGRLQRVKECTCSDCGKPATDYDHRDYTKPLDVVPVCRSCNIKRGPAFDSVYRPANEAA